MGLVIHIDGEIRDSDEGNATPKQRYVLFDDDAPKVDMSIQVFNKDASSTVEGSIVRDFQGREIDTAYRQQQIVQKQLMAGETDILSGALMNIPPP